MRGRLLTSGGLRLRPCASRSTRGSAPPRRRGPNRLVCRARYCVFPAIRIQSESRRSRFPSANRCRPWTGLSGRIPCRTAYVKIAPSRPVLRFAAVLPPFTLARPRALVLTRVLILPSATSCRNRSMSRRVTAATALAAKQGLDVPLDTSASIVRVLARLATPLRFRTRPAPRVLSTGRRAQLRSSLCGASVCRLQGHCPSRLRPADAALLHAQYPVSTALRADLSCTSADAGHRTVRYFRMYVTAGPVCRRAAKPDTAVSQMTSPDLMRALRAAQFELVSALI